MISRLAGRMSRAARILMAVAAVLLAGLYFTPLWSVRLVAPQYPEGLGMNIHLGTVRGVKEHDLRNINSLNHYIGMKPIEPDAIPELRYMPWIVAGLVAGGLAVAAAGRRRGLVAWTAAFAALGAAGLYDFWRWSYDYGHNLDLEHAIIIVPGMTYQPPLIGTKQLLNFTATSYPAAGGVLAGIAMALAVAAVVLSYRRARMAPATLALATACAAAQPVIHLGVDGCAQCRMIIDDGRFSAAIVTRTGKTLPFDSIDCMLERLKGLDPADVKNAWVMTGDGGGTLMAAEDAVFVHDGLIRPPMGSLVAFSREAEAAAMKGPTGVTLAWSALGEFARAETAHAR
jgi:copper chaperone NosL